MQHTHWHAKLAIAATFIRHIMGDLACKTDLTVCPLTLAKYMQINANLSFIKQFQHELSIQFCELVATSSGMEHTEMDKDNLHIKGEVEEKRLGHIHASRSLACVCMYVWGCDCDSVCVVVTVWCATLCMCAIVHTIFAQQPFHHSLFLLPCSDVGLCLSSHLLLSVLALFSLLPCCLGLLIQAQLQYKYTAAHTVHGIPYKHYIHHTHTTRTQGG